MDNWNIIIAIVKKNLLILLFVSLLILFIFPRIILASSFDFQLVPRTTKSSSSDGYFSKIPLSTLTVQKGKLDFYKKDGWDFIRFEGDYDGKTGELKGVFAGASTSKNFPNSGASYYCEFSAEIKKDQKSTTLKYYPTHGTAETLNHCYSQVVFDFEKNHKAPKDDWWPDDLVFDVVPLDSDGVEDSGVRFSDIYGEVEILLPTGYNDDGEPVFDDEEGWNHAKLDMELPYGAKLRLKERSGIILAVPGSEPYELKTPENDEAIIILPTKQKKDSVFRLLGGQLYNNVKKILKEGSMDIEMGQAVAGIKGTIFVLEENGGKSLLKVIEGEVEFRSKANGQSEIAKSGDLIVASADGLSEKTSFDVSAERSRWDSAKQNSLKAPYLFDSKANYLWFFGGLVLVFVLAWRFKKKVNR